MLYGVLYGAERMIVEGMRTDSLYIGDTTLRVSQLLSLIIAVVALSFFIYFMVRYRKNTLPESMLPIIPDEDPNKKKKDRKKKAKEKANADN